MTAKEAKEGKVRGNVKKAGVMPQPAPPARKRVVVEAEPSGEEVPIPVPNYFASSDAKDIDFVSSGCEIFNQVIGGGYPLGRFVNIVGDKSSGKTLLAIEACANMARKYPNALIRYAEAEAAFDVSYAAALGMPVEMVEFPPNILTVEDFYEDLEKFVKDLNGREGLYIVDSLDSLGDRASLKRDIDEGSYNLTKQKQMGEIFRRMVALLEESKVLLIIISQIREKIGVTFGETKTRSGGKALDFYASQIIWLSEIEKLKKTIDGVERIVGVNVKANCKKNKVGLPFRTCTYHILFGYGIDDVMAGVEWLIEVKATNRLEELGLTAGGYKIRINNLREKGGAEFKDLREKLNKVVADEWCRIETKFLPKVSKYE